MQDTPNIVTNTETLDALSALYTRTLDVLAGYDTMMDKAEPGFRPTVARYRDLHTRQAAQLATLLVASGRNPDDAGSVMGSINAAVVSLRAFFDEIDADVLKQIHNGESHVLAAFDNVMRSGNETDGLPGSALDLIERMRAELTSLLQSTPPRD